MTVKSAIEIIDWLIANKREAIKGMDLNNYESIRDLAGGFIEMVKRGIINLEDVKKELVPNCKHPKKMRDKCGKQEYCMSCNWDF